MEEIIEFNENNPLININEETKTQEVDSYDTE
jgi:hypothetical protein